ncbi:serine/threonine-protein kinase AtPK2/AtPK19-like [Centruroides sculpturatus]|uniref:serine/threonine-protein kinase AtPK2/AtPK19-like n=1 Tax=Centruroides sculpturatus TaxID=218467 RepID=UPI000C6E6B79|nr:serine/threonine-protein kinase AtPK2/AtPK19-like [Centruroides sculpturatus]
MRCVRKFLLRMWSERERRKKREEKAEPNGQQDKNYPINIDDNFLETKCHTFKKKETQFQEKIPKKKGKFTEFCRNAFCKFFCCMSKEISDSQKCQLVNNLEKDSELEFEKYNQNVIEDFEFKEIGKGNFGTVYSVLCKTSNERVAIKTIQKKRFCLQQRGEIKREQEAWASSSSHPHIVTLFGCFKTNTSFCFVSDYVDGQDLTNYLETNGRFREIQAKLIASQVASAIMFIHNKGIIHRDISSSNIMLDKTKGAQLIDFGLCTFERNPKQFCGTLFYVCPEILQGKSYDAYCDWWSFGTVLYQMLIGSTPMDIYLEKMKVDINSLSITDMINIAQNMELVYPTHLLLSMDSTLIIEDLLQKDPNKRLSETDISKHMYFDGVPWPELVQT